MNSPVFDFVQKYADENNIRCHVPGHKGINSVFSESLDITEISGADVLYHESGILKQSQNNTASLFDTSETLFSTEGSSLSIRAMLFLIKKFCVTNNLPPVIAASRNAHKVFINTCALLDIEVEWIYSDLEYGIINSTITASKLDTFLSTSNKKPSAVYITSPDYLGFISDIKSISHICKKHNCLLCVDNAHGAYLKFLNKSMHPIDLGADICCDSAHKTFPVLTGGAYLHISKNAPEILKKEAKFAMSLFSSTSPSYLILASLDLNNIYLSTTYKNELNYFISILDEIKSKLKAAKYVLIGNEPLKICIETNSYGYYGDKIAEILENNGIICEYYDKNYVVLMLTPKLSDNQIKHIENVLLDIPKLTPINEKSPNISKLSQCVPPSKVLYTKTIETDVLNSLGKILADSSVSCPPAVPIGIMGEKINKDTIDLFLHYNIKTIKVIDE